MTISSVNPVKKLIGVLLKGSNSVEDEDEDQAEEESLGTSIKKAITQYLDNKLTHHLYNKACFLDPRFKDEHQNISTELLQEAASSLPNGKL